MTTGPRFSGGYQFPRTDAASLRREPPIREEGPIGTQRATVTLTPLVGGRQGVVYELATSYSDDDTNTAGTTSTLLDDADAAKGAFAELVAQLGRGGLLPDLLGG